MYHFAHLWQLTSRGVFWVTRSKANLGLQVKKRLPAHADPRILRDDLVVLQGVKTAKTYPPRLRRVTTRIEIDGQERLMVFLTNNLDWSPVPACDLYRCRWQILSKNQLSHKNHQLHRRPPPPCSHSYASTCIVMPSPCGTGLI